MYADVLKDRKKKMGWTTEELSFRSGVPVGTINKILNGETKSPRYDTMDALEAAFKKEEEKELFIKETAAYGSQDLKKYTVEDYYNFPEDVRVELIDGQIYYMAGPSTEHQSAVVRMIIQTGNYIDQNGGGCLPFTAPVDVQLDCDDKTMLQPDFMIICDREKVYKDRIYGPPDFVAEVLSPSSRYVDGNVKLRKYLAAGVMEYWIVDLARRRVISYYKEDDYLPFIYSMEEPVPVKFYRGELKIHF